MTEQEIIEKRVGQWRLAVWLVLLLTTFLRYPQAWPAAACGVLFTVLWGVVRKSRPAPLPQEEDETLPEVAPDRMGRTLDVGMDLVPLTFLIFYTGGFASPFAWLNFLVLAEAGVLLGGPASLYTAFAIALLNLVHFRTGVTPAAAALYGAASGTLFVSALLVGWSQAVGSGGALFAPKKQTLFKERTVEAVEEQLEEEQRAHRQLRDTYREVARLHREQKGQLELLRLSEQFFEISATAPLQEGDDQIPCQKLLRLVMDTLDAGGGVLWRRVPHTDTLEIRLTEGRVAPDLFLGPIEDVRSLSPVEIRVHCEAQLTVLAPQLTLALDGEVLPPGAPAPMPILVALLFARSEADTLPQVIGAVGLCEARGASRFHQADQERLHTLTEPLATALRNVEHRREAQRSIRELNILYDLSRLVQSATDMEQIYKAVVMQVQKVVPCENCTLFLLDKANQRLEQKASRGRVVNLLDHIAFEKGDGISGWVAARGRQVVIADLTREANLLNIELIPPRVRSFVAAPLRVQNNIVGVIVLSHAQANAFSPEDLQLLTILAGQAAVTIERTEVFHTMEALAITDGLTHVYNHRYFQMRLDDEIRRSKRYRYPLCVMILDADHFKALNDQYGHASGDLALRELATVLRESVRETEIVARYGGEEFAILLPQTDMEQAYTAAERVRANIADHTFCSVDGRPLTVTVSIGVATFPQHAQGRGDLLEEADRALYAAKRAGRNRVCIAGDEAAPEPEVVPVLVPAKRGRRAA